MISLTITENEASMRLDRLLRKKLPLMSLSGVYSLIRRGEARVNGRKVKQDCRLAEGDLLEINVNQAELTAPKSGPAPAFADLVNTVFYKKNFAVLYEDNDLLACNKPGGLVVHSGTGHLRHDTLIDLATAYLLSKKKIRDPEEVSLVHRLDRDTSGVILIAKNKLAARRLHETFRERALVKDYMAVCHGRPPKDKGEIFVRLARGRDEGGETTMRVHESGLPTRSTYRVDGCEGGLSRLEVQLITGKTHQIRVHLAHVGAPILGDVRYGDPKLDDAVFRARPHLSRRLYLHAQRLEVPHPRGGRSIVIKAPLPEEFRRAL